jgi:hypothetical protein
MSRARMRLLGWAGLHCAALTSVAVAQPSRDSGRGRWTIGVSIGVSSYSTVSEGKDPEGVTLRFAPYRPTMWGLEATYGGGPVRVGLAARYGQAGIGTRGLSFQDDGAIPGPLLVVDNAYHLAVFTGSLSAHLLRLRGGPSVRPSVGLDLQRWAGAGSPARTILGGQTGLAVEVALTRALLASLEGQLGFTPASPFRKEDLPQGFDQRSAWRRTLAGAVYWRF